MKKFKTTVFSLLMLSLLISACTKSTVDSESGSRLTTYTPVSQDLYDTIASMDSVLFDAFNKKDLPTLGKMFSQDLEFYHDLGGVTNYSQNMEAFKRTFDGARKVRRELVAGSLEVYPIKDY